MDLFEAINTRRSVRRFTDEAVPDEDLALVLKAAMQAPSAVNQQPWQFVAIRDAALRGAVSKASPYAGMAAKAPVVIVICGDVREAKAADFWPQDCSAAAENLLLAARGAGLGAVWCGIYPEAERMESLKKTLGLPDGVIPFALICMGHTDQEFNYIDRFKPDRVHMDGWNS